MESDEAETYVALRYTMPAKNYEDAGIFIHSLPAIVIQEAGPVGRTYEMKIAWIRLMLIQLSTRDEIFKTITDALVRYHKFS
jgi:hypothetical protein